LEQDRVALCYENVLDETKVARGRALEYYRVFALDHEAGYVEGPEVYPDVIVGLVVTATCEMVKSCWKIDHEMTVHEDL